MVSAAFAFVRYLSFVIIRSLHKERKEENHTPPLFQDAFQQAKILTLCLTLTLHIGHLANLSFGLVRSSSLMGMV
jgi:hypothetical protein